MPRVLRDDNHVGAWLDMHQGCMNVGCRELRAQLKKSGEELPSVGYNDPGCLM